MGTVEERAINRASCYMHGFKDRNRNAGSCIDLVMYCNIFFMQAKTYVSQEKRRDENKEEKDREKYR